ncbi:MAG: hypothetical protein HXY50_07485, partial [Ignavibacteriaceae bacterium]|nr:hypothetical protein [Ignavibacteriaceae bacterium]
MKRLFVLCLFLFSVSLFAQATIDWETVGQDWPWVLFANGPQQDSTDYAVVANPAVGGINTSANCGFIKVRVNADPWVGIFADVTPFVLTADNCKPTLMVYKTIISNVNIKLEGPGLNHDTKVPNTLINQWEKIEFDLTADIGKTVNRVVIMPDFPDTRTDSSLAYFDNLEFVHTGTPTINWETLGNNWTWNIFSAGAGGSYAVAPNPNKTGINTSDSCGRLIVGANGDPWAGVWCSDFPDMLIDESNCIIKVMVNKNVISNFNLKLEPPNVDHNVPNTVVNQWEELTFDYSSAIGTTANVLTIIPDFPATRTAGSLNYFDNIQFTALVIPVELESFTGAVVGNNVRLQWTTSSESNNRGFEIQRSINNSAFTAIDFVPGAGTSTEKHSYTFTDNSGVEGKLLYRLKQIDYDGTHEFSNVVEVTRVTSYGLSQNYPNP